MFSNDNHKHDTALKKVPQVLHDSGLTINAKKCEFNKSEVTCYGYIFSKDELSQDPVKVKALHVHDAMPPTNATEVRSFLGMAQYSS